MAMMNLKGLMKEKTLTEDDKKPSLLKRKPGMKPKKNALAARLTGGK